VEVGDGAGPVGVNLRHVHPRREGAGEGVEEALLGLVDLGDAEDVVDVVDDRQPLGRDEVGGCVAGQGAVGVDVQTLDLRGAVAGHEAAAGDVLDGDEGVEVAFGCGGVREPDVLCPTAGRDGSTASLLSGGAGSRRGFEVERYVLVALLQDVDLRRQVPRL